MIKAIIFTFQISFCLVLLITIKSSQSHENPAILHKTRGISIICDDECSACRNDDPSNCTECKPGFQLYNITNKCLKTCPQGLYGYNQTCVENCPEGYNSTNESICEECKVSQCKKCSTNFSTCDLCKNGFQFDSINNACKNCNNECLTCNGELSTNCTSCKNPNYFYQNQCFAKCPSGTFAKNDSKTMNMCVKCHSNCKECVGDTDQQCLSCVEGRVLNLSYIFKPQGPCLEDCPDYFYANNSSVCIKCPVKCKSCLAQDYFVNCTECGDNYKLQPAISNYQICIENCPQFQFQLVEILNISICAACNANCYQCQGPLEEHCLSCNQNRYLYNASCLSSCPENQYANTTIFECELCDNSCVKCNGVSSSSCTECKKGQYLKRTRAHMEIYKGECKDVDVNNIKEAVEFFNQTDFVKNHLLAEILLNEIGKTFDKIKIFQDFILNGQQEYTKYFDEFIKYYGTITGNDTMKMQFLIDYYKFINYLCKAHYKVSDNSTWVLKISQQINTCSAMMSGISDDLNIYNQQILLNIFTLFTFNTSTILTVDSKDNLIGIFEILRRCLYNESFLEKPNVTENTQDYTPGFIIQILKISIPQNQKYINISHNFSSIFVNYHSTGEAISEISFYDIIFLHKQTASSILPNTSKSSISSDIIDINPLYKNWSQIPHREGYFKNKLKSEITITFYHLPHLESEKKTQRCIAMTEMPEFSLMKWESDKSSQSTKLVEEYINDTNYTTVICSFYHLSQYGVEVTDLIPDSGGVNAGIIIGIIIGALFSALFVVLIVYILKKYWKKSGISRDDIAYNKLQEKTKPREPSVKKPKKLLR